MVVTDVWSELQDAVERDSWDACEQWMEKHAATPGAEIAVVAVGDNLDRYRSRRGTDELGADGLLEVLRRYFQSIVRLRRLAERARGHVAEVRTAPRAHYGVRVEAAEALVGMAVGATRPTIVTARIARERSAREQRQLVEVLGELAFHDRDELGNGEDCSLEVGHVCFLGTMVAPLLASRWKVAPGHALAPWLDAADVVSVEPAGGRLAFTPRVAKLQQEIRRLHTAVTLKPPGAPPAARDDERLDTIRDELDLLEAYGWTPAVEPVSDATKQFLHELEREPERPLSAIARALGWIAPEA